MRDDFQITALIRFAPGLAFVGPFFLAVAKTANRASVVFAIGNAITFLISRVATGYGFDWKYVFSLQSLLVGGGASVLTGLIFGLYPAKQAAIKSPMEALKFE